MNHQNPVVPPESGVHPQNPVCTYSVSQVTRLDGDGEPGKKEARGGRGWALGLWMRHGGRGACRVWKIELYQCENDDINKSDN